MSQIVTERIDVVASWSILGGMTGRFVLVVGLVVVLAGCGKPAQPGGLPSAPASPSSAPSPSASASQPLTPPAPATTGTPEQQILAQYVSFTTVALPRAYVAPPAKRRSLLDPVTTEPALSIYLRQIAQLDSKSQQAKGHPVPISQTVQRSGHTALVRMCVDSSKTGIYNQKTGEQLTIGPSREVLLGTLKLTPGGIWKVSGTSFQEQSC
ncbi:hypothetical protein [Fodinicola acaciae]|uniref:hypothetical protein n=1 Tax=Fodinicola acaciae TaxID=2681555 RepID=UPI0013D1DFC4|nr:hypothetical protein [Fodinicola acaciae]